MDDVDSGENCFWHQSLQVLGGSAEWMEMETEAKKEGSRSENPFVNQCLVGPRTKREMG